MTTPTESPMTEQQHPIFPPPELVHQWHKEACKDPYNGGAFFESKTLKHIATQAARWGADQQLEADCEWLTDQCLHLDGSYLRSAMRPKPPSLKEQALADMDSMSIEPCWVNGIDVNASVRAKYDNIRRALEALPDDN